MRDLLHLYLLHEYHWLTCFPKDHFLDDMLSESERFCSSLLVNAVLAQACVSIPLYYSHYLFQDSDAYGQHCHLAIRDRAEHWNPHSLGYRFLAEAKDYGKWSSVERALRPP